MIGNRVKELRTNILRINQNDFAEMLGVSQGALSDIENGGRGLPVEAVAKLAEMSLCDLRIDVAWILTGKNSHGLNMRELELVENFRALDEHGKGAVENVVCYEKGSIKRADYE